MRWLTCLVVASACGGPSAPARPAPPVTEPARAPAEAGPGEAECDELITHAVALGIAERTAGATTQADHEAVRRGLREDFMTRCRALSRDAFRCALAATSLDALAACDQRTPSSSTSNSKVAPPGITPPAPRSP